MLPGDLTTLAHVKEWLGIASNVTNSDELLSRLITSASRFVLNYLNRQSLAAQSYSDLVDSYGKNWMLLRQWPVISFASAVFMGQTVDTEATGNPPTNGYLLQGYNRDDGPQKIVLFGSCFPKGRAAVTFNYSAGYQITGESHVVPAMAAFTVTTDYTWLADGGVTLGGVALTKVTGAPAAMQYAVDDDGVYTFNDAQASATVLITYSYVPPDVEQAVWELVGLRYNEKSRIGVQSKSLAGQETVSFWMGTMTNAIQSALGPYRRVVPS